MPSMADFLQRLAKPWNMTGYAFAETFLIANSYLAFEKRCGLITFNVETSYKTESMLHLILNYALRPSRKNLDIH